jgi:hypothetical protein
MRPSSIGVAVVVWGAWPTRVRSRSKSERVACSFTWEPHPTTTRLSDRGNRKALRMTTSG